MQIPTRTIAIGDNLPIMRQLEDNAIKLVYLDPPFNSKRNYKSTIGSEAEGSAFKDTWNANDLNQDQIDEIEHLSPASSTIIETSRQTAGKSMQAYLAFMVIRLIEIKRLLRSDGSLFLHCDSSAAAYLKLLCDAIFGIKQFRNEIVWKRTTSHNDARRIFARITDTILFYDFGRMYTDNIRIPYTAEYIKCKYRFEDERGIYAESKITTQSTYSAYQYEFGGHIRYWLYPRHRLVELQADNRIHFPKKRGGIPSVKRYLHEMKGKLPTSLWDDIQLVKTNSPEGTGFRTQKPIELLKRIILAATQPGDMVFDPFMGSGTTLVAAEQLERQWFGIDVNPKHGDIAATRLKTDCNLFDA